MSCRMAALMVLTMGILAPCALALRHLGQAALISNSSMQENFLFCTAFVLHTEGLFSMIEKQFKKCDHYAFLSTYDDPERRIVKVLNTPPAKSQLNWPIAEAMWDNMREHAEDFKWFVKIDSDSFFRPNQMRAALAKYNPDEAVALGRPGRNGKIMLVGAAYALSGTLVKQLPTKRLDPVELAKGTWHGEDRVMAVWIPEAGGIIKNAINADNGCTSFSSTDRQELPTDDDVRAMKSGKTYTKFAPSRKVNMQLGDICYSADLAVIHPVKDPLRYAYLLENLDA